MQEAANKQKRITLKTVSVPVVLCPGGSLSDVDILK
jgi:hypothetical protein